MAESQVDGSLGLKPLGKQLLYGLKDTDDADFVVHCPTTPNKAIGDCSREGWVRPLVFGGWIYRYHVHVTH